LNQIHGQSRSWIKMINLFEYKNKVHFEEGLSELEIFLDEIWVKREKYSMYADVNDEKIETQRFIQIFHNTSDIKSNKYVGVIHFNGTKINLLPKIFFDPQREVNDSDIMHMQQHILWWLSYCRKIKFPNYMTSLGDTKSDFLEILIYLFAKYTRNLLGSTVFQQYQEIHEKTSFIKGRIDTPKYIDRSLATGNWHHVPCIYDAFVMDNEFNRIVKYVATMLFHASSQQENKKYLREILFILDDVTDTSVSAEQCARIHFNPMFKDFETVRDYCTLFLQNSISFNYKNELKLFAFLLPMEYVFEDFIYGFIEKELKEIHAVSQGKSIHLDESKSFALKPDLFIQNGDQSFIADTKYKIVYSDESDPKKGISQTDLYQMLAYSIRFNVDTVILYYPNTIVHNQLSSFELTIQDSFADNREITIHAYQLPIIQEDLFHNAANHHDSLQDMFKPLQQALIERLTQTLSM